MNPYTLLCTLYSVSIVCIEGNYSSENKTRLCIARICSKRILIPRGGDFYFQWQVNCVLLHSFLLKAFLSFSIWYNVMSEVRPMLMRNMFQIKIFHNLHEGGRSSLSIIPLFIMTQLHMTVHVRFPSKYKLTDSDMHVSVPIFLPT